MHLPDGGRMAPYVVCSVNTIGRLLRAESACRLDQIGHSGGHELHALRGAERVLSDNPAIKLLVGFRPFGLRAAGNPPGRADCLLLRVRMQI